MLNSFFIPPNAWGEVKITGPEKCHCHQDFTFTQVLYTRLSEPPHPMGRSCPLLKTENHPLLKTKEPLKVPC